MAAPGFSVSPRNTSELKEYLAALSALHHIEALLEIIEAEAMGDYRSHVSNLRRRNEIVKFLIDGGGSLLTFVPGDVD